MSVREASRVFGLHRDTVRKMLAYSAPPGYRRQSPPRRPKLEAFTQGTSLARLGQVLSGLVDRSNAEGGIRKGMAGRAIGPGRC